MTVADLDLYDYGVQVVIRGSYRDQREAVRALFRASPQGADRSLEAFVSEVRGRGFEVERMWRRRSIRYNEQE